ncbi:MAG: hypothetical protein JWN07_2903 [Hyphomicrobiales bacterium]|nr:hypothetical protein [Hyphomicrobiales bacterium]
MPKLIYLAIDRFDTFGHPAETLKALSAGASADWDLVLASPPQPAPVTLARHHAGIPTREEMTTLSPVVTGARIRDCLEAIGVDSDDIVLLKMPLPALLLSLTYAVVLGLPPSRMPHVKVMISETDINYAAEPILYSDAFSILEKLPAEVRARFTILCERHALLAHWSQKFPGLTYGTCSYISRSKHVAPSGVEPVIAYIGEARGEKGFYELPALVTASGELRYFVHTDANELNRGPEYTATIDQLKHLADERENLVLLSQETQADYDLAFAGNHICLMLYGAQYRLRGSGIVQEAAANGLFVLAYEDLGFHLDFPDHVLTLERGLPPQELARRVAEAVADVAARRRPAALEFTARHFFEIVSRRTAPPAVFRPVFITCNNVQNEGCSQIIAGQQHHAVASGHYPIFVTCDWPSFTQATDIHTAHRSMLESMTFNSTSSYGYGFLLLPGFYSGADRFAEYSRFRYTDLVELNQQCDLSSSRALVRSLVPTAILNYSHFHPMLTALGVARADAALEMHDISSEQQRIRGAFGDDEFAAQFAQEMADVRGFGTVWVLSRAEQSKLAAQGVNCELHNYSEYFRARAQGASAYSRRRHFSTLYRESAPFRDRMKSARHACASGDTIHFSIIGSGHPANVEGILGFLRSLSSARISDRYVFYFAGKVCEHLRRECETLPPRVVLLDFLRDIDPLIRLSDACINPVNLGTGLPIKVMDAISRQTPCISTERTIAALGAHPMLVPLSDDLFSPERENDLETRLKAARRTQLATSSEAAPSVERFLNARRHL